MVSHTLGIRSRFNGCYSCTRQLKANVSEGSDANSFKTLELALQCNRKATLVGELHHRKNWVV